MGEQLHFYTDADMRAFIRILRLLRRRPGLFKARICQMREFKARPIYEKALDRAVDEGLVEEQPGPSDGKHYHLTRFGVKAERFRARFLSGIPARIPAASSVRVG